MILGIGLGAYKDRNKKENSKKDKNKVFNQSLDNRPKDDFKINSNKRNKEFSFNSDTIKKFLSEQLDKKDVKSQVISQIEDEVENLKERDISAGDLAKLRIEVERSNFMETLKEFEPEVSANSAIEESVVLGSELNSEKLAKMIIMKEILDKPKSLRED